MLAVPRLVQRIRVSQRHRVSSVKAILPLFVALFPLSKARAFSSTSTMSNLPTPTQLQPYDPPSWASNVLLNTPLHGRLHLANLPTPLYRLDTFSNDYNLTSWFIKRDDMTGGVELGGNKVRKLEFLLADALANDYNAVVTIGGEQSNHCRATAAAARMLGLEPHLILRTKRVHDEQSFGYTGNILFDRMVGSTIYTCTPGEYGRVGSNELVKRVCNHIESSHDEKRAYPIPVGGSNGLGSWGYINGVDELMEQWRKSHAGKLDHVVFACGSGGTAAGIALGIALAYGAAESKEQRNNQMPVVHAMGVCDDPDYFYDHVAEIADEMGFSLPLTTARDFIRKHLVVHQAKGLGYAASTPEELEFVTQFALDTGIVLDPVYSGKALYHFLTDVVKKNPQEYRGKNMLFWHTGGALGLYEKGDALLETLNQVSPVKRLDVYGKGGDNMVSI